MISFDDLLKYLKYIIPVSIPILYLQGIVYYQGKLNGAGIRYGFYPLPFEDALSESFIFYLSSIIYLFYLTIIWTVLAFIVSWLSIKLQRREASKMHKSVSNKIIKLWEFIIKNRGNFLVPGILFFSIYAIFFLGFAVALPYIAGSHQGLKQFKEAIAKFPKNGETIFITNGKETVKKKVVILQLSKDYISFYENNSVFTYPCSRIEKIEHKLIKPPNKSFQGTAGSSRFF